MRFSLHPVAAGLTALAAAGNAIAAPPPAAAVERSSQQACSLQALAMPLPAGAKISSATASATPAPHCRIRGTISSQTPNPNTINFSLALPDKFNGRYVYEAPGGSAGTVSEPTGWLLEQGYALATGDQGTRPAFGMDFKWREDPAQLLDYNHRAIHVTANLTQAITRAYYAAQPVRYLMGCSGGGRSGRNNMRTYGAADFDGVLAGAAPSNAANQIGLARIAQYITRHPESWIPPELLKRAEQKIIETYDAADGAKDGVIQDERLIRFDSSILRDIGLTPEQIRLVDFIRAPWPYLSEPRPETSKGEAAGLGISRITEWTQWAVGSVPPPWKVDTKGAPLGFLVGDSTLRAFHGEDFDWINKYDFSNPKDFREWTTGIGEGNGTGGFNYAEFARQGGKAVFYLGAGDAAVPPSDQFLSLVESRRFFPDDALWSRYYLVPAWGHCGPTGGVGPDRDSVSSAMLDALVQWVEQGQPPADVVAARAAKSGLPAREFRLCPEPKRAVLNSGQVNHDVARSWSCERRPAH